jgi:hypothetical protein
MSNIGSGGLRRFLTATIAVASVASGLALCAAGPAYADETTVEQKYPAVPGGIKINLSAQKCPANAPYLKNHNYSPGRIVPNGLEVIEMGGIGVTMGTQMGPRIPYNPPGGTGKHPAIAAVQESTAQFAIGTTGGTASNWGSEPGDVIVKLWCTSNSYDGWYEPN